MPTIRILVVDDFEPFRRVVRSILQHRDDLQVIGEASDGLEAVSKARELRPDLILLDIALPKLNGMEAARRIRRLVPGSRILLVSQESDIEIVQEALCLGIPGYLSKMNTGTELVKAADALLEGKHFISRSLASTALREGLKGVTQFQFAYDGENQIFLGKFQGPVTDVSIARYYRVAAIQVAGADFRGGITDFSGGTSFNATPQAIRELAALAPADPVTSRPRVVVAPDTVMFELARMFQELGKETRPNLHVVRDLRSAFELLQLDAPRFEPIQPGCLLDQM